MKEFSLKLKVLSENIMLSDNHVTHNFHIIFFKHYILYYYIYLYAILKYVHADTNTNTR